MRDIEPNITVLLLIIVTIVLVIYMDMEHSTREDNSREFHRNSLSAGNTVDAKSAVSNILMFQHERFAACTDSHPSG